MTERPRVCVIVSGGLVQGVRSTTAEVDVDVVDFDNLRDLGERHPGTGAPWTEEQLDAEDVRIQAQYPVVAY